MNPLSYFILAYQDVLYHNVFLSVDRLIALLILTFLSLVFGLFTISCTVKFDSLKRFNVLSGEIQVINVSKAFTIRHNKADSLKSKVIGIFHKRYREQRETLWALKGVSFNVSPGEVFGLVGRNGSGKSTLLKIIAGIYPPTEGKVRLPNGARMGTMIEIGVGFHPELTGKENIFLSASIHGLNRKGD